MLELNVLMQAEQALVSLDSDVLVSLYSDDFVFEDTSSGEILTDKGALREYFDRLFSLPAARFSNVTYFSAESMARGNGPCPENRSNRATRMPSEARRSSSSLRKRSRRSIMDPHQSDRLATTWPIATPARSEANPTIMKLDALVPSGVWEPDSADRDDCGENVGVGAILVAVACGVEVEGGCSFVSSFPGVLVGKVHLVGCGVGA